MNTITIDQFNQIEIRVGKVIEATNAEGSEKLIRLSVDFAEHGQRIIFTGVRPYGYTPEDFEGKQFLFCTNLEPKKMVGEESQGMILAVDGLELPYGQVGSAKPIFIEVSSLPIGAKIR